MAPEIFISRVLRATRCSEQVTSLTGEPWFYSRVGRTPHPCQAGVSWPPGGEPLSLHLLLLLPSTATHGCCCYCPLLPPSTSTSPSLLFLPATALTLPQPPGWLQEHKMTRSVCHEEVCALCSQLRKAVQQAHLLTASYREWLLETFGSTRSIGSFDTFVCLTVCVLTHQETNTGNPQTSWSGTVVSQQQSNWKKGKQPTNPNP